MKKIFVAGAVLMALTSLDASADIKVKLPAGSGVDSISYQYTPILKLVSAKSRAERGTQEGVAIVKDGVAIIPVDNAEGGSSYGISLNDDAYFSLYTSPGDNVLVEVASVEPFDYKLSGTPITDVINDLEAISAPLEEKQKALMAAGGEPDREKMQEIYNEYLDGVNDYIEENITSPDVVYAVMQLPGEDYIKAFDRLSERAKTSILYPIANKQYEYVKEGIEKEKRQQEMANGTTPAPEFTLKNLEGKDVSLSEFKGKWVILDFWGSWCIWCIKGFPELKDAYAKYKDRLEVIGLDCNESEEAWKAGVEKYELPGSTCIVPKGILSWNNMAFRDSLQKR